MLILRAAFPLHKIPKVSQQFIPSTNLLLVRNDLPMDDSFYLPLQVSLYMFRVWWWLFASWSAGELIGFQYGNTKSKRNFPPWGYLQLVGHVSFHFSDFERAIEFRTHHLLWSLGAYVFRIQHFHVANIDAGLCRCFGVLILRS